MRIISGEHRGKKLLDFDGMNIRPTTDRVKESMFNLIQEYIRDAEVLDVFSGSGALSLEALSRGAKSAVCLDIDSRSVDVIKKNIQALNYADKCVVFNIDCRQYLKNCKKKFDVVFLDPPYNKGLIEPVLLDIKNYGVLSEDAIIVLESDDTDFYGEAEGFSVLKQRKYGRTYITVYTQNKEV